MAITPGRHRCHKLDYLEFLATEVASLCRDGFCSSSCRGFSFYMWSSLGFKRYGMPWTRYSFFFKSILSLVICLPRPWPYYSCFHFPFCYFILCNVFSTLIHVMIIYSTVLHLKIGHDASKYRWWETVLNRRLLKILAKFPEEFRFLFSTHKIAQTLTNRPFAGSGHMVRNKLC